MYVTQCELHYYSRHAHVSLSLVNTIALRCVALRTTVNYTVTNALKDMTYGPLCGGRPLRELQPTTPLHVAYSRTYWTRSDARLLPSRELGLESRDSPADQEGPKSGYALE